MKSIFERRLFTFIALAVFIFIVLRAIYVPMVFDEIWTFFHYVRPVNLTPFNDYTAANNHLLNTNLTYLSYNLFGNEPIFLRLPNVLSFLVFAYYLFKIGTDYIKNVIPKWAFFITLLFAIHFISFFSLSRGYGLSFAFMTASIYYTIKSFEKPSSKVVLVSVVFMMLALFANFSTLLFVLISLLILAINVLTKTKIYFNKSNIPFSIAGFVVAVVSLGYVLNTLFLYKEQGHLYWGNLDGFWVSTIYSLYDLIFQIPEGSTLIDVFLIIFSLVILVLLFFKGFFKKENVFSFLLILNVLGIIILANFLKVNYPVQRIALHLFVLFIGAYCFSISKVSNKTIQLLALIPFIVFPLYSINNLNLSYVSCWEEDGIPIRFLDKVIDIEKKSKNNQTLSIYGEGSSGYCWAYELDKQGINFATMVDAREDEKRNYDYVIEKRENITSFKHLYDSIEYDKFSTHMLLKRKKPTNKELLFETGVIENKKVTDQEFVELTRTKKDSIGVSSLFVDFEIQMEAAIPSFQNWAVVSVKNLRTGEDVAYKSIKMDWKNEWKADNLIKQGVYLNNLPKSDELEILIYIWNIKKKPYDLIYAKSKVHRVIEDYTR